MDDVPFEVVGTSLVPMDMSRTADIVIELTAPVDAATLSPGAVVVVPGKASEAFVSDVNNPPLSDSRVDDIVPAAVSLDGNSIIWRPTRALAAETLHTLIVSSAVRDKSGHELPAAYVAAFTTGDIANGAPELQLRYPSPGFAELPRNVAQVIVGFSEPVQGVASDSIVIDGVPSHVEAATAWCDACWAVVLEQWLEADATYSLVAKETIHDDDGETVFAGAPVTFGVTDQIDEAPPVLGNATVGQSGSCAVARWISDEPATSAMLEMFLPTFVVVHEVGMELPPATYEVTMVSQDWAALVGELGPIEVQVVSLPALVINEVMANPLGPEPAQEWVELANLSGAAVDLTGWTIADSSGSDALPSVVLESDEVALIVSNSFQALEGSDPPPHPAARLITLESSIGESGMRNTGEAIYLHDTLEQVVSSYGGYLDTGSGRSAMRAGTCDVAASWITSEKGASTPGRL